MNDQNMDINLSYGASHDALRKSVASKLFIVNVAALALYIIVCLVDFAFNAFFYGTLSFGSDVYLYATRVTSVVYSRMGYLIIALVKLLVPVALIYTFVYMIVLRKTKCKDPVTHVYKTRRAPSVLQLFAILTCIEIAMFVFAFSFNMFKAKNFTFFDNALTFYGLTQLGDFFGITELLGSMSNPIVKIVVTVFVDIALLVYAVAQFLLFKYMKNFLIALSDIVGSQIAQMQEKPPMILSYIFGGLNIVFAGLMIINGSLITAALHVAMAAYLFSMAVFLHNIYKNIVTNGN